MSRWSLRCIVTLAALIIADESTPFAGSAERPYLTWDGSGRRGDLEEAGFRLRSRLTQFYQEEHPTQALIKRVPSASPPGKTSFKCKGSSHD